MAAETVGMGREPSMGSVLIVALNQIYIVSMNFMMYFLDLLSFNLRTVKKNKNK